MQPLLQRWVKASTLQTSHRLSMVVSGQQRRFPPNSSEAIGVLVRTGLDHTSPERARELIAALAASPRPQAARVLVECALEAEDTKIRAVAAGRVAERFLRMSISVLARPVETDRP